MKSTLGLRKISSWQCSEGQEKIGGYQEEGSVTLVTVLVTRAKHLTTTNVRKKGLTV